MKRGEVWTLAGGKDYSGKPRPVVLVQADRFDVFDSVTVCGLTTVDDGVPLIRPEVVPTAANGLRARSFFMVDKISTVPKRKLGRRLGALAASDMRKLGGAIVAFLDLAG